VFANNADTAANFKTQFEIKDMPSSVFTIAVNPNPAIKQFAFGLGNGGGLYLCNYDVETKSPEFSPYGGEFNKVVVEQIQEEKIRHD